LGPTQVGLVPEETGDVNGVSSLHDSRMVPRFQRFLRRLFELNAASDRPLAIREMTQIERLVRQGLPAAPTQPGAPGLILCFDYEGNVCTFSPQLLTARHPLHGDNLIGNVFSSSLEDMFKGEKFSTLYAEVCRGVERCHRTCSYFRFCGGGFPYNKL